MPVPDPPERCSADLPLRHEGGRAARAADRLGDVVGRDEDHGRGGMRGAQAASRLEPVHPRHSHVDDDQLGGELGDGERGLTGRCLAEELEARGRLDHVADAATERLVVVDGHDPD